MHALAIDSDMRSMQKLLLELEVLAAESVLQDVEWSHPWHSPQVGVPQVAEGPVHV